MRKMLSAFRRDDSGAAMAEYAILVSLIAVVAIAGVSVAGTQISVKFADVATALECRNTKGKTLENDLDATGNPIPDGKGGNKQSLQCQK